MSVHTDRPRGLLPVLLGLALVTLAPVVSADPPRWAPAHGYREKHTYVYYPSQQVYYAPTTQLWFWMDRNGNWRSGVTLPGGFAVASSQGVTLGLSVDRPYLVHQEVVREYGGGPRGRRDEGWHEGKRHGEGHGHGRGHRD